MNESTGESSPAAEIAPPQRATTDKSISSTRRRAGPKLSPEALAMRQELSQLVKNRQPIDVNALAERHGVSPNSIYKAMYLLGKPPTHTLPEETKTALREALPELWKDTKISIQEIADKYGVSLSTVHLMRRQLELPKRARPSARLPQTTRMEEALPTLLEKKVKLAAIATRFGVSEDTVRKRIRKMKEETPKSQDS